MTNENENAPKPIRISAEIYPNAELLACVAAQIEDELANTCELTLTDKEDMREAIQSCRDGKPNKLARLALREYLMFRAGFGSGGGTYSDWRENYGAQN